MNIDMNTRGRKVHPIVRTAAAFGACICLFAFVISLTQAIADYLSVFQFCLACGKAGAILYLGGFFWYAFTQGKAPVNTAP